MKIGYIGLGKMGKNMVLRFLEQGIEVVAWNRSKEPLNEVVAKGAEIANDIKDLVKKIESPRIVWLMLPAGDITDEILNVVAPLLKAGDLVIDGANSFYKDTLRRGAKLKEKGIRFMDIGVSGGPDGARNGACLMVGGEKEDYEKVLPIIKSASAPDAYGLFGELGSGHFAKMVHNGIEYGMMEAIAEGASVLKNSQFKLDLVKIFEIYNNKSVIESRLVGWTKNALETDPELSDISAKIDASGEGEWTVNTAKEIEIEVPIIEESHNVRIKSKLANQNPRNEFRNKVVSAMRGQLGHHDVKSK